VSRVLVTGASGFIGSHAIRALAREGHEIHAVARRAPAGSDLLSWHEADLLDPRASTALMKSVRPERLLHLAWYAEHGRFWSAPENLRWVEASLALLRAFASVGGERAILAGTCAEYDWTALDRSGAQAGTPPRCEETRTPMVPHTLYGASKYAMYLVAERFAETVGIELACGRVFFLYGPGEQSGRLVPSIARSLLAGEPVLTSDGEQIRDFMHVEDVAAGFAALLAGDVRGPVNLASGEAVAVRTVVEMLARNVGAPELVRWGALPRGAADPDVLLADVGRLHKEVSFSPKIGLAEGLAGTVDWWREHPEALVRAGRR